MARRETFFYCQKDTIKKGYHGRSGGLLILVIVIMAVAVILITSALTITVAARRHYYDNAVSSQARLTSASAAKTIAEAIISGNIRDAEIQALANERQPVVVYSASSAASAATKNTGNTFTPGLKGTAGTSITTVTFSYYPTGTNASTATYIMGQVDTTLALPAGDNVTPSTDTVVFMLEKKPVTPIGDAFGSLATLGGDATVNTLARTSIGAGTPDGTPVVLHGNVTVSGSDLILNTPVVVTGQLRLSASCVYNKDVILYGDKSSLYNDNGGGLTLNGNLFAIGTSSVKSLFTNASYAPATFSGSGGYTINGGVYIGKRLWNQSLNWLPINPSAYVVADDNSTINFIPNVSGVAAKYLRADSSAAIVVGGVADSSIESAATYPIITTLRNAAASYTASVATNAARTIPTTTEALALLGLTGKGSTGAQMVASMGAVQIPTASFHGVNYTYSYPVGNASSYYINVSSALTLGTGSSNNHTSIVFDLSGGSITLYLIGGSTLTLDSGLIKFINGTDTNVGKIVLLDSTDIYIGANWSSWVEDSGIIGTAHQALSGNRTTYVANSKPFLYIYGTGNNTIRAYGDGGSLEGYIGLYGDNGKLDLETFRYFYGRIESSYLTSEGGAVANGNPIPYCPSPKDAGGGSGLPTPVSSIYQIVGYVTK